MNKTVLTLIKFMRETTILRMHLNWSLNRPSTETFLYSYIYKGQQADFKNISTFTWDCKNLKDKNNLNHWGKEQAHDDHEIRNIESPESQNLHIWWLLMIRSHLMVGPTKESFQCTDWSRQACISFWEDLQRSRMQHLFKMTSGNCSK